MKTILFQGDSITDACRARDDDAYMGVGYANLVKGQLSYDYPNQYVFHNRGISGNRIVDLYARMKKDIIHLQPDIMSILIGVNDVWHECDYNDGVDAEKFFKIYSMLIEEVQAALPHLQIMILEPFTLKGSGNEKYWDVFQSEVYQRAEQARRIADTYNLPFVALQEKFDAATKLAPAEYWLMDGVHPHTSGHELIKRAWIEAFQNI